jgi:nucleoid-associated protein YgaU
MTNQARIDQIAAQIAALNAELEALKQPVARAEEVIIDDPDQDDVDVEYRGTLILAILVIVVVALGMLFGGKVVGLMSDIKQTAAPLVLEDITIAATRLPEPVAVNTAAVQATTYTVQKGDTLWSIAQQHLGDGASWAVIYGQNADIIGDNPDLIFPGQTITISSVVTNVQVVW